MFHLPGYQWKMVSHDNRGRVTQISRKERVTSFSQVEAHMANCSYDFAHFDQLLFSFCGFFWALSMVGSRCVVQDCSNGSNRAAGIALHASPNDKNTRDAWARFVRTKRKNFHPLPKTRFVICSVHFEESCFTRAFDPSQRRQIKPGPLPTIWKKGERTTDVESKRSLRMMEKKRQKVSLRLRQTRQKCRVRVRVRV